MISSHAIENSQNSAYLHIFKNCFLGVTTKNRKSHEEWSRLSASLSASDERQLKMDRLTASKSMFEKDKFAESLVHNVLL